jgi:copper chaperone NosL
MNTNSKLAVVALLVFVMSACGASGPAPIVYGEDACHYCNMTIMERGFASQLVTTKGKVYKFDAIECLAAYRYAGSIDPDEVHSQWVCNFNNAGSFLNTDNAVFVYSKQIKSPMAGGLCAVDSRDVAVRVRDSFNGRIVTWDEVCDIVGAAWNVKPVSHTEL